MVRAAAYRQCGGYEALRLTVLDDIKLGQLLVRAGKRTRAFLGVNDVECHWGTTVWSMVKLVEKNNFAALDFRFGLALTLSLAGILIFCIIVRGLMTGTAAGLTAALSPLTLILPASILASARGPLCHSQLDLGDAAPRGHPLARHVLFAGNLAHGDREVN
jgi:hypothetical protein